MVTSPRVQNAADFDRLVGPYQDAAYNVAYRILGERERAAAATQEALRAAYQSLPAFRGGSFQAWLLRRVADACRSQWRRGTARPVSPDRSRVAGEGPRAPGRPVSTPQPGLPQELVAALEAGISGLPWEERVVLVLADVQGLRLDEIAEATGAPLRAVRSRLSRARARLRDHLVHSRNL